MMSVGIPMIAAGQDFMFSKYGATNTYNRGDLNALNYRLLKKHFVTHRYFQELIKLRLSPQGRVLCLPETPRKTYFRFFSSPTSSACALVYNADGQLDEKSLIFAINPHPFEFTIEFGDFNIESCKVMADEEKFFTPHKKFYDKFVDGTLTLPPLSCRIYLP
jgi:pullulanase/glycogen debranching enzyme